MKLCMIGNSHLACLKQAWDEAPRPGLEPGFFGAPRDLLKTLVLENGRIGSPDRAVRAILAGVSGGADTLDPRAWDGFVLVGLALHVIPPVQADRLDGRLSAAVQQATLRARFARTAMAHVLGLLRQVTDRPAWLLPTPLPRPPAPGAAKPLPPDVAGHAAGLTRLRQALETGPTRLLGQPPDTILHDRWTRPDYGERAIGLMPDETGSFVKPPEDRTHMNAAFGRRLWAMLETACLGGQRRLETGRVVR
jgi:hypothetical protein